MTQPICCLMFNGVTHMYNRIDITKRKEKEVEVVTSAGVPDNMADVLDEVMDFDSNDDAIPNMDDHVFDEDYEDIDDDDKLGEDNTDT